MSQPNEVLNLGIDPANDDKNTSGRKYGKIPPGVAGWSWDGFLLTPIWSVFNNTYIGLLSLLPGIGFCLSIYLGLTGRELAWQNKRWKSVEHFKHVQRQWSIATLIAGLVLASASLFIVLFGEIPQQGANDESAKLKTVFNEGNLALKNGDFDKALRNFTEAIRINPKLAAAYFNRGLVMTQKNDYQAAIEDISEALRLDPDDANANHYLAWLLATNPDDNIRVSQRAIDLATKACKRSGWRNPKYIQTLAAANANAGDWENAVERQKRVIEMVTDDEDKEFANHLLKLYEQKTPLRFGSPDQPENDQGRSNETKN